MRNNFVLLCLICTSTTDFLGTLGSVHFAGERCPVPACSLALEGNIVALRWDVLRIEVDIPVGLDPGWIFFERYFEERSEHRVDDIRHHVSREHYKVCTSCQAGHVYVSSNAPRCALSILPKYFPQLRGPLAALHPGAAAPADKEQEPRNLTSLLLLLSSNILSASYLSTQAIELSPFHLSPRT